LGALQHDVEIEKNRSMDGKLQGLFSCGQTPIDHIGDPHGVYF
jgi:hypothetical protein